MKRLLRRHLLHAAAGVLLLAVVPNAAYIGHWPFVSGSQSYDTAAEAHAHAGHCPAGPSNCTDAPPASPHPILMTENSLALAAFGLLLLVVLDTRFPSGNPFTQRITKPPRRTSAVFAA
jgi:hypothetical protein